MESDDAELTMADELRELQAALDSAIAENDGLRAENAELKRMRDAIVEVLRAVNPYVQ
jgi:regulator of replication initiation timing